MPMKRDIYPANWESMRQTALAKAQHRCSGCGCTDLEDGTNSTRLTVHHPDRDPRNRRPRLTVLCAACHIAVEAIARRRQRIIATANPDETLADAWKRARAGVSPDQVSLDAGLHTHREEQEHLHEHDTVREDGFV